MDRGNPCLSRRDCAKSSWKLRHESLSYLRWIIDNYRGLASRYECVCFSQGSSWDADSFNFAGQPAAQLWETLRLETRLDVDRISYHQKDMTNRLCGPSHSPLVCFLPLLQSIVGRDAVCRAFVTREFRHFQGGIHDRSRISGSPPAARDVLDASAHAHGRGVRNPYALDDGQRLVSALIFECSECHPVGKLSFRSFR